MQHKLRDLHSVRWQSAPLAQERNMPLNPWRGLYAIYPFVIGDEDTEQALPQLRPEHSLAMVEINLVRFRQELLDDAALKQIDRILHWFQDNRQEIILRFLYDLDGNGLQNEPQEITVILGHMRQLSVLLHRYAKLIFTLQGVFAGSWGEMHSSRHLGASSMSTLMRALDEAAGGELLLAVRCPNQWREILQAYDAPPADHRFDGKLHSRIGLFNDGILASETDFGTYGQVSRAQAPTFGTKLNREDELNFQNRLCAGVPNGGELVWGEGGFTLPEIYRAFRMMRLTYLNEDFDVMAFDNLRAQKNIARDRVWRGVSACEYLMAHLGYRYGVRKAMVQRAGEELSVRVQIINTGFACCYFPLETVLYLKSPAGDIIRSSPVPGDARRWQPGEKVWLETKMRTELVPTGEYRLELGISDLRSGKPVYLSTTAHGETVRQTLLLGTLKMRRR